MKRNSVWVLERSGNGGDFVPFFSFIFEEDAESSLEYSKTNREGEFRLRKYVAEGG